MVEAAAHRHPFVDLDEFERRLRGSGPSAGQESKNDFQAELARLVNSDQTRDPYAAAASLFAMRDPTSTIGVREEGSGQGSHQDRRLEPTFNHLDFRGSLDEQERLSIQEQFARELQQLSQSRALHEPYAGQPGELSDQAYSFDESYGQDRQAEFAAVESPAPTVVVERMSPRTKSTSAQRSIKPLVYMGVIFVVGMSAIGATMLMRHKRPVTSAEMPIIKASQVPAKVAPEKNDGLVIPNQDAAVLDKNAAKIQDSKVNNTGLATHAEQPVDLNQLVKNPQLQSTNLPTSPVSTAAEPPSPTAQVVPGLDQVYGAPKKVHSLAIRKDGSLLEKPPSNGTGFNGVPVLPPRPVRPATTITGQTSATPSPATPSVKSIVKPSVKVAPLTKPLSPTQKSGVIAAVPAEVDNDQNLTDEADTQNTQQSGKDLASANNDNAVASRSKPALAGNTASGQYAVQFAAPLSQDEAQQTALRLERRYSEALSGRSLSVHQASSNGTTVYRIRVTGLSKEEASAMCSTIQGGGGSCFVSR